MDLTAINDIQLPNNEDFTLDEATVGESLANWFEKFLGIRTPKLQMATGNRNQNFLQLEGTLEELTHFPTLTLGSISVTLYLFDFIREGWQERHCLFLTEAISSADFTPINLIRSYTTDFSMPSFIGEADVGSFLGKVEFGADRQLVFSSIDYADERYATAPCPLKEAADTQAFFDKIKREKIQQGFSFWMTPTVNIARNGQVDVLSDLDIPKISGTLWTHIEYGFGAFTLVMTYFPKDASFDIGGFKMNCTAMSFSFDLELTKALFPSIRIEGKAKYKDSSIDYALVLSLGNKTISVIFSEFPTFNELSSSVGNLKQQIADNLPGVAVKTLGEITISKLSFEASFSGNWGIAAMELEVVLAKPLVFIEEVMQIEPHLTIQMQRPFEAAQRQYRLEVGGLWTLGSGDTASQLSTTIVKSSEDFTLTASLANGSSIDIANFVKYAISDKSLSQNLPKIEILDLEASADFTNKTYELEASFISDWELPILPTDMGIGLKDLEFYINFANNQLEELNLDGTLRFAGLDLFLKGTFNTTDGWFFRAHVNPGGRIGDFLGKLRGKNSGDTDVLSSFPLFADASVMDISVNGLYVEYRKGVQTTAVPNPPSFSFFCSLHTTIPIIGHSLVLNNVLARFEYKSSTAKTKGVLTGLIYAEFEIKKDGKKISGMMLSAEKKGTGYIFKGGTLPNQKLPIGDVIKSLMLNLGVSNEVIPDILDDFVVDHLSVEFKTITKTINGKKKNTANEFNFICHCTVALDENNPNHVAKAQVNIDFTKDAAKPKADFEKEYSGFIWIEGYKFNLNFQQNTQPSTSTIGGTTIQSSTVVGTFANESGKLINLHQLVNTFSHDVAELIPKGFDISLKDVFFARYNEKKKNAKGAGQFTNVFSGYLIGADLDMELNLNDLPLVGKKLPDDVGLGVRNFKILIASKVFLDKRLTNINGILAKHNISNIPEKHASSNEVSSSNDQKDHLPKGLSIAGIVQIADVEKAFLLTAGSAPKPSRPKKQSINTKLSKPGWNSNRTSDKPTVTNTNTETPTPEPVITPAKRDHGATWIPIQKSVGPIHFDRIGVSYKDGKVLFLLDASMQMGGVTVGFEGLTLGSPIDHFAPEFDLHGLVIDYKRMPTLEIGGGLLKAAPPPEGTIFEFDGAIVLRTKALSAIALGSYAKLTSGSPSFFMYLAIDGLKIGPPWFLVTGLSMGFGINRKLVAPAIDEMDQFPLVSEVIYTKNKNKQVGSGTENDRNKLMHELEKLKKYIPPQEGQYFIAIGLKFTTFKIVDAFALAVVQFGERLRVDIFGRMFLRHPPVQAAGGNTGMPLLVNVAIDLHAYVYPDEGVLGLEMDIKEGSYIYSQLCHITGRLALKAWFAGEHDGDFVFVMGGYHDLFKVPSHYPSRSWLKPMSIYWKVNNDLYVKGNFYFALTPKALMAGGSLEANFNTAHFHASFRIYADFLIFFKPFWYDARVGIDMSVTAGIPTFFGDIEIHMGLHADLHIWGPDFSGEAHVEIMGIGFGVTFGAGASKLPPIPWSEFKQSFLPKPEKVMTIVNQGGLLSKIKDRHKDFEWWLVNKKQFSVALNSTIPITHADFYAETYTEASKVHLFLGKAFGISPMHLETANGHAQLDIIITQKDAGDVDRDSFAFRPIYKAVPAGLWGNYRHSALEGEQTIPDTLVGVELVLGKPPKPGVTKPVPTENLKYDNFSVVDSFNWEASCYFQDSNNGDATIKKTHTYSKELTDLMVASECDFDTGDADYQAGAYIKNLKVVELI